MEEIRKGSPIRVRDVHGRWLDRVALTGIIQGRDFDVVWASRPEEWVAAYDDGRDPEGAPWPAEDVKLRDTRLAVQEHAHA